MIKEPVETTTNSRILGLPQVARLAAFASGPGPGVLLTTGERTALYRSGFAFGSRVSVDPELADWADRSDKVVLSLQHALRSFPSDPDAYVLELEKGGSYPRG